MIHVECPFSYFRFDHGEGDELESDPAICTQYDSQFLAEKIEPRIRLDSNDIQRKSVTSVLLIVAGIILGIIALVTFIRGDEFPIPIQCGAIGLLLFGAGKLIEILSDIRWFTKTNAEREFRSKR